MTGNKPMPRERQVRHDDIATKWLKFIVMRIAKATACTPRLLGVKYG
jgi:hypothetical protein